MATITAAAEVTREQLSERVGVLPRVRIAALPTPLEEMPRLRAALGANTPRLFVKRDDLTGLAFGGNKVRHLEFRIADALKKGADTLIVTNVAQSNHARLHTAVAAKFGLTNYIIKIPSKKDDPIQGNLLLDHIMGAMIIEAESDEPAAIERQLDALIARLKAEGHVPYDVPRDRFSKIAGTCGFLLAAVEILGQLDTMGASVDHIFMASGTSSAGLALAGKLLGAPYRVHPISVGGSRDVIQAQTLEYANSAAALIGLTTQLTAADFTVHDAYVGERYGVVTAAGLEALSLAGRSEGLILDPVYTAKALSGLIDQIRKGAIGKDESVLFVHTGGLPITFAYNEEIMEGLRGAHSG
jgi:L-cysteate sulfo-lyase